MQIRCLRERGETLRKTRKTFGENKTRRRNKKTGRREKHCGVDKDRRLRQVWASQRGEKEPRVFLGITTHQGTISRTEPGNTKDTGTRTFSSLEEGKNKKKHASSWWAWSIGQWHGYNHLSQALIFQCSARLQRSKRTLLCLDGTYLNHMHTMRHSTSVCVFTSSVPAATFALQSIFVVVYVIFCTTRKSGISVVQFLQQSQRCTRALCNLAHSTPFT